MAMSGPGSAADKAPRRHTAAGKIWPEHLKAHGVPKEDVPSPLNVFQTMVIDAKKGTMRYSMTRPRAGGDEMDFRAEMDCLVGISACPEGGRGKDLRVMIYKE